MINRMKMHRFLSVWQTAINIPSRPIFLLPVLCTSKGSREKAFFLRPSQPKEGGLREGLLTCTKWDEFSRKNTTAPPSFSENYVANFLWWIWLHICKEVWGPDIMKCRHMPSSKCVLVWFFPIQLLKKTYSEPWIYSFCINSMLKRPYLKFPKSAK